MGTQPLAGGVETGTTLLLEGNLSVCNKSLEHCGLVIPLCFHI